MRTRILGLALGTAVAACSSVAAVKLAGDADVTGFVVQANSAPVAATTVMISCSGAATPVSVRTDSAGLYTATLTLAPAAFAQSGGMAACNFWVPDSSAATIHLQTSVQFYAAGLPHPVQRVDVRTAH